MDINRTCAFTGHRETENDIDLPYIEDCVRGIIGEGYDTFLCGMAWGFDLLAASAVLRLKSEYPHIKLIACVPCPGQERNFPADEKIKYGEIIKNCDEVRVLSKNFYKGCMYARNRYMVDNCAALLAYERRQEGGTHYTLKYAKDKSKRIFIV